MAFRCIEFPKVKAFTTDKHACLPAGLVQFGSRYELATHLGNLREVQPKVVKLPLWAAFPVALSGGPDRFVILYETGFKHSTPSRIRTYNLRFRRPMLYPVELWVHLLRS